MQASSKLDIARLADEVRRRAVDRPRILLGIDGPGASGKSTLADLLATHIPDAAVVHVDDFYLPSALQGSRAGAIAPYFDWPRLIDQVVAPAAAGRRLRYQRYDWGTDELADWVTVPAASPVILEGVYCLERGLRQSYTYSIFCLADPAVRLRRGLERDGEGARLQWVDEWMPAEDAYVASERPDQFADLLLDSSSAEPTGTRYFGVVRCSSSLTS